MAEGLSVGVSEVEVVMEAEWLSGRGQSERTWVRVHGVPLLLWQWNCCYSNEKQCYWFHPNPMDWKEFSDRLLLNSDQAIYECIVNDMEV